jgi:putative transposase
MPRKARIEFAGAAYHLLDRGDRREAIFHDERDREIFLATLGEGQERVRANY